MRMRIPTMTKVASAATLALQLAACGGSGSTATLATEAAAAKPVSCADLAKQTFHSTTITSTTLITRGTLAVPASSNGGVSMTLTGLPNFCRIVATVSPSSSEEIGVEIWLPAAGWNGRFLGVGSGGLGGYFSYASSGGLGSKGLPDALEQGYAVASTNTGHTGASLMAPGTNYPWMHNNAQIGDWGHSSVHYMTQLAKSVTTAFYAQAPNKSYFDGCSTGGAEAMEEAIYFPTDYDGIHAGTPGMDYTRLMAQFIWNAQVLNANPQLLSKLTLLNNAVLSACDRLDGVTDGVIENPMACHFDPASLQCTNGQDQSTCLTASEVQGVQKIYGGPTNPITGAEVYPGMARGSELGWSYIPYLTQGVTIPLMQNMVYDNLSWTVSNFDFNLDVAFLDDKLQSLITATSPDLSQFEAHGGKLLMTDGWASQFDSQLYVPEYHHDVTATMGDTSSFYRLFMAPGVGHCGGGAGPNTADYMSALTAWVEKGVAPTQIVATKYTNDDPTQPVIRTRPLCQWPQTAHYNGTGSTDDATNFTCN